MKSGSSWAGWPSQAQRKGQESFRNDGEVKEMIIGVGNEKFVWDGDRWRSELPGPSPQLSQQMQFLFWQCSLPASSLLQKTRTWRFRPYPSQLARQSVNMCTSRYPNASSNWGGETDSGLQPQNQAIDTPDGVRRCAGLGFRGRVATL